MRWRYYMREDHIHYHVRSYLKEKVWQLIAGQYPNGSDDELPPLNVVDPALARDNSPDHRRHSLHKLVPDLVAIKQNKMLIIEFKPTYYHQDEIKLKELLGIRRNDLLSALQQLIKRGVTFEFPLEDYTMIPCLGFSGLSKFTKDTEFCYFLVDAAGEVLFLGNLQLGEL